MIEIALEKNYKRGYQVGQVGLTSNSLVTKLLWSQLCVSKINEQKSQRTWHAWVNLLKRN